MSPIIKNELSKEMNIDRVLSILTKKNRDIDEYCFGVNSYSMAVALNRIFPQSKIIVSCNAALYNRADVMIGHAAILLGGVLIDGSGVISKPELRSWGVIESTDLDYLEAFPEDDKVTAKDWVTLSQEVLYEEFSKKEIMDFCDHTVIEKIIWLIYRK